ncbi:MAG: DUF58 domain-containing protein [Chloroflexota bacterium]
MFSSDSQAVEATQENNQSADEQVLSARREGMFNEAWIWLAVFLLVAGLISNQISFYLLAACLFTIIAVSWLWSKYSLKNVIYRRSFNRLRVFPGEQITMQLEVINRKLLPLSWIRMADEVPVNISPSDESVITSTVPTASGKLMSAFTLRSYQRLVRKLTLQCRTRGHYVIGPVTVESGDLFSLFSTSERRLITDSIVVYPQIFPLEELGFPHRAPFGTLKIQDSLIKDPSRTRSIRDYRPEDSFRHIHWKASARRAALQTRVYEPGTDMNVTLALNVQTLPKLWMGVRPDLLERAVSVTASIAHYAAERDWSVGLISNGVPRSDQPIKLLPSKSPEQLPIILEALADVSSFTMGSIESILQAESPNIPLGSTLVVISSIVPEDMLVTLNYLREAGRKVVLVSLAKEAVSDPRLTIYNIGSPAMESNHSALERNTVASLSTVPVPKPIEVPLELS